MFSTIFNSSQSKCLLFKMVWTYNHHSIFTRQRWSYWHSTRKTNVFILMFDRQNDSLCVVQKKQFLHVSFGMILILAASLHWGTGPNQSNETYKYNGDFNQTRVRAIQRNRKTNKMHYNRVQRFLDLMASAIDPGAEAECSISLHLPTSGESWQNFHRNKQEVKDRCACWIHT